MSAYMAVSYNSRVAIHLTYRRLRVPIPFLIFSAVSGFSALLCVWLPETQGQIAPQFLPGRENLTVGTERNSNRVTGLHLLIINFQVFEDLYYFGEV